MIEAFSKVAESTLMGSQRSKSLRGLRSAKRLRPARAMLLLFQAMLATKAQANVDFQILAGAGGVPLGLFKGPEQTKFFGSPADLTTQFLVGGESIGLIMGAQFSHLELRSLTQGQLLQGSMDTSGAVGGLSLYGSSTQWQLVGHYAWHHELAVSSTVKVTVNGQSYGHLDTATYSGGKSYGGRLNIIMNRGAPTGKLKPQGVWGLFMGYLDQSYQKKTVEVTTLGSDLGPEKTVVRSKVSYTLKAPMLGLFIGHNI